MEGFVLHILKLNIIAAVIILLVKAAAVLLEGKFTAQWKYLIWLVLSLSLLVPVRLPDEHSLVQVQIHVSDAAPGDASALMRVPAENTVSSGAQNKSTDKAVPDNNTGLEGMALQRSFRPLFFKIFVIVWASVACIRLACGILGYVFSTGRLRRMSISVYNVYTQNAYRAVCRSKGIKNPPVLMQNAGLSTPLLTGVFRPELYLPAIGYTAEELKLIFHHELAHYRRRDLWYKLLLKLCAGVYWFNPFLLIMLKEAENDIENLCDSHVVRSCTANDHRLYRRLLLKTVAMQNHIPYVTASLNDSTMVFKERILYMVNLKRLRKSPLPGVLLAVLFVVSNAVFSLSAVASEPVAATDQITAVPMVPVIDSSVAVPEASLENSPRNLVNMVNYTPEQESPDVQAEQNVNSAASGALSEEAGDHEAYDNENYTAPSENSSNSGNYGDQGINDDPGDEEYQDPSYTEDSGETEGEPDGGSGINNPYDLYSWDGGTNSFIPFQEADGEGLPIERGSWEGWYYFDETTGAYLPW